MVLTENEGTVWGSADVADPADAEFSRRGGAFSQAHTARRQAPASACFSSGDSLYIYLLTSTGTPLPQYRRFSR